MSSVIFFDTIKREMAEHLLLNMKDGVDGAIAHGLQRAYQLGAESDGAAISLTDIEKAVNAMSADDLCLVLVVTKRALDTRRAGAKARASEGDLFSRDGVPLATPPSVMLETNAAPISSSFLDKACEYTYSASPEAGGH